MPSELLSPPRSHTRFRKRVPVGGPRTSQGGRKQPSLSLIGKFSIIMSPTSVNSIGLQSLSSNHKRSSPNQSASSVSQGLSTCTIIMEQSLSGRAACINSNTREENSSGPAKRDCDKPTEKCKKPPGATPGGLEKRLATAGNQLSTNANSKVGRPRPDDDHLRMRRTKLQRLRPKVTLLCKSLG